MRSTSNTRACVAATLALALGYLVTMPACGVANQAMNTANNAASTANNVSQAAGGGGCKTDNDCKGDRVCKNSACVDPATGKADPSASKLSDQPAAGTPAAGGGAAAPAAATVAPPQGIPPQRLPEPDF